MRKFGLPIQVFSKMLARQSNKCSICDRRFDSDRLACVDHDHSCCPGENCCGECIRGILCDACNVALGYFRDNTTILRNAVTYLETYLPIRNCPELSAVDVAVGV